MCFYVNKSIVHSVYYITHVYMHLQYNNTSYALCAYDPLIIISIFAIISFIQ